MSPSGSIRTERVYTPLSPAQKRARINRVARALEQGVGVRDLEHVRKFTRAEIEAAQTLLVEQQAKKKRR